MYAYMLSCPLIYRYFEHFMKNKIIDICTTDVCMYVCMLYTHNHEGFYNALQLKGYYCFARISPIFSYLCTINVYS